LGKASGGRARKRKGPGRDKKKASMSFRISEMLELCPLSNPMTCGRTAGVLVPARRPATREPWQAREGFGTIPRCPVESMRCQNYVASQFPRLAGMPANGDPSNTRGVRLKIDLSGKKSRKDDFASAGEPHDRQPWRRRFRSGLPLSADVPRC